MRKRGKSNVSYLLFGILAFIFALSFSIKNNVGNIRIEAKDNSLLCGNTIGREDGTSYCPSSVVDNTPPTYTSYTGGNSSWVYTATLSINGASDAGVGLHSTPYCFSTSSSSSGCSLWQSSSTLSIKTQTDTYYYAYIRDANKNIKNAGSQQVRVDRTAPSITNVKGGGSTWYKTSTTLIVAATDSHSGINSTGYCFIGSSSTSAPGYSSSCWQNSASKEVSTTMYKYYHIYVRDAVDNKKYYGFKQTLIDPTAPSAGISGGGSSWATSRELTITASDSISGLAGSPYCFISSTSTSAPGSSGCSWTSSESLTINSTMDKYYHGYARDEAGNIKYAGYQQVRVDVVAPTISCNGSSLSSGTHYFSQCLLSFSDSASGIASTSVDPAPSKLQGAAGLTYAGDSNAYYGTINGTSTPTTYTVQIYDMAGNETNRKFTLYSGSPTIKCEWKDKDEDKDKDKDSTSSTIYINSSCSLSFSDDIILSSYSISGPVSSSSSLLGKTKTYGTLSKEGRYTITVTNAAGESSTTTLYIDKTNPYMYTTSGSNLSSSSTNLYKASQMTFYFGDALSGYSKATHDCQGCSPSMGSLYDTTSSPITLYASISPIFYITVYDNADNNVKYTIEFDTTAPTIKCGSKTLSTTNTISKSCTVYFSDDNFSRFDIQNGGKEIDTGYSTSYTLKGDGDYTIFAYDKVGNYSEGNITIDDTAPSMKYRTADLKVYPEKNYISGSSATFTFEDGGSGFDYHTYDVRGSDATALEKSTSASRRLVAGHYTYYIKAYDKAGNESYYHIVIDDTAPTIKCGNTLLGGEEYTFSSTCELTFDDDIAFSEYFINGTGFKNSDTYSLSKDGTYLIVAFDKAGNETQVTVTIDTTAPVWSTSDVSSVTTMTSITFSLTDNIAINSDFSSKFGYGWTDSLTSKPSSPKNDYTTNKTKEFTFSVYAPAVLSAKKYYLWITPRGEDTVGNSATYSGKKFDEKGNYIVYEYTIIPATVVDNEAPKILCSGSTPSSGVSMSGCSLIFTDNINLASYSIYNGGLGNNNLLSSGSIEGTFHFVGNLEENYGAGEYEIVVTDAAGNTTTIDNILIKTNGPELKMNGSTLIKKSGYFVNSSVTLTASESTFVMISGNQFGNEENKYGFELSQQDYLYYETPSSISLDSTLKSLLNTAGGYDLSKYGYALEIKLGDSLGNENIYYLNVCDIILSPVVVNGTSYTSNVNLSVYGDFTMSIDEDVKVKGTNEDEFKSYFSKNKVVNIGTKNGNVTYTDIFGNTLEVTVTSRSTDFTENDLYLLIDGTKYVPVNNGVYYSSTSVTPQEGNSDLTLSSSNVGTGLTKYTATLSNNTIVFYVYVDDTAMMPIRSGSQTLTYESNYTMSTGSVLTTGLNIDVSDFYKWNDTYGTYNKTVTSAGTYTLTLKYTNIGEVSNYINVSINETISNGNAVSDTTGPEIEINVEEENNNGGTITDNGTEYEWYAFSRANEEITISISDDLSGVKSAKYWTNLENKFEFTGDGTTIPDNSLVLTFDSKNEVVIYKVEAIDNSNNSSEKIFIIVSKKSGIELNDISLGESISKEEKGKYLFNKNVSSVDTAIRKIGDTEINNDNDTYSFSINETNEKIQTSGSENKVIKFTYALLGNPIDIDFAETLEYNIVVNSNSNIVEYIEACIELATEKNYNDIIENGISNTQSTSLYSVNYTTKKIVTLSGKVISQTSPSITFNFETFFGEFIDTGVLDDIKGKSAYGYITYNYNFNNVNDVKDALEDNGIRLELDASENLKMDIYNEKYNMAIFEIYSYSGVGTGVPIPLIISNDSINLTTTTEVVNNGIVVLNLQGYEDKKKYLI